MINGAQIFIHFPIFNVVFPSFSQIFIDNLVTIATFDIFDPTWVFGERESADDAIVERSRYEKAGYSSGIFIFNMGALFITLVIMLLMPLLLMVYSRFKNRFPWCQRKHVALGDALRGNMWLRFIMEANLDISVAGAINLTIIMQQGFVAFKSWFDIMNTIFLFTLISIVAIFPFAILFFYLKNLDKWGDEKFQERYGAPFEGLDKEKKSIVVYPFTFCVRRLLLTAAIVFFNEHFFIQMASTLVLSTIQIWYLGDYRPFEELLVLRLEIFNEVTTIILVYILMFFSAANAASVDSEMSIDILFATFLVGNLCVHLFFLLWDICHNMKLKYRQRQFRKNQDEARQAKKRAQFYL